MGSLLTRGLAAITLVLTALPAFAADEPITLRIGSGFPRGFRAFDSLEAAGRSIAAKTAGRVKIEFQGQTTLGQEDLPRLDAGELDGAVVPSAMLEDRTPSAAALALPLAVETLEEAEAVATALEPAVAAELGAKGLVPLGRASIGFAYVISLPAIRMPADFQGKRLWTPKQEGESFDFGAAGAQSVPLGIDEVEAGLRQAAEAAPSAQAGAPAGAPAETRPGVDAVIILPDFAIMKQWHAHVKHVLDLPLFLVEFRLVVRATALERLSAADRELVASELRSSFAAIEADRRVRAQSFRRVLERAGIELHVATAQERAAWDEWRKGLWERFTKDRGIPAAALAAMAAAREQHRKSQAPPKRSE